MQRTAGWHEVEVGEPPGATFAARTLLAMFACGIPLDQLPLTTTASATFALGIALFVGGAFEILVAGRLRPPTVLVLLLTAFVAWSSISILWSRNPQMAIERWKTAVQLLAFVWIAWQIARSRRDVTAMAAGYVIGCTVAAFAVLRELQSGRVAYDYEVRYVAQGFDPNDLGITLATGMAIAVYLAHRGKRRRDALWLVYLPLALTAIVLSGSRSAFLAMAVALAVAIGCARQRHAGVIVGALALLVVGGALASIIVPQEVWARIFTMRESLAHGTLGGRTAIWIAGLGAFAKHPLFGIGIGGFGDAVAFVTGQRGGAAHNTLLSVGVELGTVGVLLFVAAVASAVLNGLRSAAPEKLLALSALATWGIGAASLTWEFRKVTWFVLLLAAAMRAVSRAEAAAAREPA
jgi:O-antigen ligase